MMSQPLQRLVRHLHALDHDPETGPGDGQLLRLFVTGRDEAAFAALVRRHGPMVLGVCRRALGPTPDAEDAFQATFLVLVHKAASIRTPASLGNWLYGVASRLARKSRLAAARRLARRRPLPDVAAAEPFERAVEPEWLPLLDEELRRLPDKYRAPLVLCYLEGHSYAEAARLLGWAAGTVSGRLARAREMLRQRLTRRGVALSAASFAAAVPAEVLAVPVSSGLVNATVRVTGPLLDGPSAAAAIPAAVAALARGVVQAIFVRQAAVLLLGALACVSAGFGLARSVGEKTPIVPAPADAVPPAVLAAAEPPARTRLIQVPARRDGVILVVGTEVKEGEEVPPKRLLTVRVGNETRKFRRLREGDVVVADQLLASLDDRVARDELAIKQSKAAAAAAEQLAAEKTRDEAKARLETAKRLHERNPQAMTIEEVRERQLALDKYFYEAISKKEAVTVARLEANQAKTILEMYEIRSPAAGVIKAVYKSAGEGVKGAPVFEPVFQIQVVDEPD